MVFACCAVGCHTRQGQSPGISFYRFPTDPVKREAWVAAVKRVAWEPTKYSRLCSKHFISGKKSDHPLSPDFIPSVFVYTTSPHKHRGKSVLANFHRRQKSKQKRREEQKRSTAVHALLDLSANVDNENHVSKSWYPKSGIVAASHFTSSVYIPCGCKYGSFTPSWLSLSRYRCLLGPSKSLTTLDSDVVVLGLSMFDLVLETPG